MENYDNEIFGFGNNSNEDVEQTTNFDYNSNEDVEQTTNFDYNSINGLGESNYENEDLFSIEVDNNQYNNEMFNDINNGEIQQNTSQIYDEDSNVEEMFEVPTQIELNTSQTLDNFNEYNPEDLVNEEITSSLDNYSNDFRIGNTSTLENLNSQPEEINQNDSLENISTLEQKELDEGLNETINNEEVSIPKENELVEEKKEISISDTPIEELNELTHYEVDHIEETDINALFDKVSVNVKDASDIFRKNTDLKQKIDTRFEELKKLQSEIENSRKKQIDEINNYKEEVLNKLTEKKNEIEKRLNLLKESQATLEHEKQEFEVYKKKEQENIDSVQKEVQSAYDDRREELNHIEDVLRKQKDALDEERNQLTLDRIQYESDKNELANNLLKFNEIVNSFTNGVNDIKE